MVFCFSVGDKGKSWSLEEGGLFCRVNFQESRKIYYNFRARRKFSLRTQKEMFWIFSYKILWMDNKYYGWIKKIMIVGRPFVLYVRFLGMPLPTAIDLFNISTLTRPSCENTISTCETSMIMEIVYLKVTFPTIIIYFLLVHFFLLNYFFVILSFPRR